MTIKDATELHDFAAINITDNDGPITNDKGHDIESGELVIGAREKPKTYCCTLIKTPWQLVPGCGAISGGLIVVVGTIVLVANQLLNQADDNQDVVAIDTILGAGMILLGAIVVLTSCGDCCLIRHFKPQKNLEGQLDDFERENAKLNVEIEGLKSNVPRMEKLLTGFEKQFEGQVQITATLKGLFEEKISALKFQIKELQLVVSNYEQKVTQGLKVFSSETDQAKELGEQLVNSNKVLRERLQELNVNVQGLAEQEKEWESDLNKLTTENDEFKQHNFELQRLGKVLQNQLAMITKLTKALSSQKDDIIIQADRLDEFDDKLVDASSDLLKVVEEKNKELQEAKIRLAQLTEAMAKFRQAIIELQRIDLSHVDSCEGLFKPLLQILDDVSDPGHDDDDDSVTIVIDD